MPLELQERQSALTTPNAPLPRSVIFAVVIPLILLSSLVVVLRREWPFTSAAVIKSLEQQSGGVVEVAGFHRIYSPYTGCVAEEVTFRRDKQSPPFLTIRKLSIQSSYLGLLRRRIETVRADGFHLVIGEGKQSPPDLGGIPSAVTIGKIVADGAEIEFPAEARGDPSRIYRVPKLTLREIADGKPLQFQTRLDLRQPSADVDVQGKIGPWRSGQAGQTALSGAYTVSNLDLTDFDGVAGKLAASGSFAGILQQVKTSGSVDVPDFEVRSSRHRIHLAAQYVATVDGLNGNVNIDAARAHFRNTTIAGAGTIADSPNKKGKTATVEMSSRQARIEDLLWMFVSDNPPSMTGPTVFRAKVLIPPEHRQFTKKIKLQGDFGVSNGQYPNPETQKNIDVLSARARGEADKVEDTQEKDSSYDPGRVVSNLKGHVEMVEGVAHLSDVTFDVPGASARLHGTYVIDGEKVDLQGYMRMDAELSKTTTGVQSVLLKVMKPFMRKSRHHKSVVAITIGGTYRHPTYTAIPKREK